MKKWVVYLLGVLTGILITVVFALLLSAMHNNNSNAEEIGDVETKMEEDNGVKYFKEPGDILEGNSFRVFQVLAEDAALVRGKKRGNSDLFLGTVCLIVNDEGKYYYDDEIINVPKDKVARQVGIYHYSNREEMMKTVPIIMIMDK
jgi:hypothetical protein